MALNAMNNTGLMLNMIAKRQKALGENIANVDTPGYTRKDVDFTKYMGSMDRSLETKLSSKFGPAPFLEGGGGGQQVNAANEWMEMQKNSLLYPMATRRMSSIIQEMKTAINVGK